MEAFVFNCFGFLFRMVGVLILSGAIVAALSDIQKKAFDSKHHGLVSLLQINQQLVGHRRP